ncbi:hydrophobe/amphiphile efflux-3 (HAE3) family protein [Halobiforma haloterrestris]|uniref:Hydrophobe/amphiphile efflux-3 (HAE3) family protein n=1 Tax=Natronobacterium haloterrestre TaxID=148448 RepID=A0A1I1K6C7_NATHA|nr:MMPL family transporter [Halobiforma haloterrestris]SFC56527.1 hydrophobe/amphiphile efflux-3 (HAE3) family protein [Halobiforma haloterrestris]
MSFPERLAGVVTNRSRTVFVVLLLATALVGAGAPMVDDDSSLEQFETDSPEAEAMEEIDDRFVASEEENTTGVQLINREGNVLTRESLLESLEFQQEIRNNESINETLVDEEPITGVENLVAITAITNEEIEDLEERGEDLEERGEELEERSADLEERGEELGQRQAELEERSAELEAGIDEARDLQREYEQLNETYDEDDPEYQQGVAEIEAEYETLLEEVTASADLDDERTAEYEAFADQAREIESQLYEIEQSADDPESVPEYGELNEQLEGVYAGATTGILEDEYAALEEDSEQLEADQEQLEEDFEAFEADQEALEDDWQELEEDDGRPPLEEQIETLEEIDDEAFEDALEETLSDDDDGGAGLAFMPSDYDPGSTEADARMTSITQETAGEGLEMGAAADSDEGVVQAQLDLRELATAHDHDQIVFGAGVITDEIDRSMGDSLAIVSPLALAFVAAALLIAYRDPLDIALGLVGIVAVLVWTFGFMGWTGIAFNQMFVAVPVLLIGLSIDYAIHVFMRHREQRETQRESHRSAGRDPETGSSALRSSMTIALAGVGVALVWVTATTAIGFLANLVSPIQPIREFGVVSAVGILAALVVFGGLIPAAKVEIDSLLEDRGYDRHKRAFGTGGGRFSSVLSAGSVAARRIPLVLVVAVLLLTAGGVYGASQVDTSFEEEDFLAQSPPDWTENLPAAMAPGEYQAADDLDYINANFQRQDAQAQILVEGDVADGDVLEELDAARDEAADSPVAYTLANGDADVRGPLSVMEETAARNESFNESFEAADTTGDGVPDENVTALYDELFEANEDGARDVLHRTDGGEYDSARLIVATDGEATFAETTDEMRAIAAGLEDGDAGVSAIATGDPIVNYIVEQDLFDTVLQSLLVTLVAVFLFLTAAYWLTGNSATLGTVTLLPVAFATSWILGTMYLVGMPFNVLTGMITSLTIGLGVAYSIHVSARYTLELERQGNVWSALDTTVTGTGGALLGSAATTVGGFGTLAFAILPVLRQFGIITALTITYAFLASVVVLPALLVFWTRYFGPDVSFDRRRSREPTTAASDGGLAIEGGDERTDSDARDDGNEDADRGDRR